MRTELRINPAKVAIVLLALVGILEILHLLSMFLQLNVDFGERARGTFLRNIVLKFDMNEEQSIQTFYSVAALLFAAATAFSIAFLRRAVGENQVYHWLGIGSLLVFMAFDESSSIHELFDHPVKTYFETSGYLAYAWIIPYSALALIVAILYLRFFLRLPNRTKVLLGTSASAYLIGALGMESIGGKIFYEELNKTNAPFLIVQSIEELLEKIGVIGAIYAMLDLMQRQLLPVEIKLTARS